MQRETCSRPAIAGLNEAQRLNRYLLYKKRYITFYSMLEDNVLFSFVFLINK